MQTAKLAPSWAQKPLEKFGRNPFGAPNFRVVWGPSRMYIVGGYWEDSGKREYRLVNKYSLDSKWVLERWRPPYIYGSPELWNMQTVQADGFLGLGPFPVHGEYESICPFSTGKGISGYVPLEPGLIEMTARAVWAGRINTYSDIRRNHEDGALAKERDHDRNFDDMWQDKQLTRTGLSIGAGGAFNKQQEIDDYVRKLERNQAFVDARRFQQGFRQN
jgi:hypothetical protein